MHRWWWRNSLGRWKRSIPGESTWGWDGLPKATFKPCAALRRGLAQDGDDFQALVEELRAYLGPERPSQVVKAIPGQNSNVPITLLGSSGFSAQLAAALGLPFAFAAHIALKICMRQRSSTVSGSAQAMHYGNRICSLRCR